MPKSADPLFDDLPEDEKPGGRLAGGAALSGRAGVLPDVEIRALVNAGEIGSLEQIGGEQIQPASIDLRLGRKAYRVRASFLPGQGVSVSQRLETLTLHEIDLREGAVLETGCVYVVPLLERLNLKKRVRAVANPKSSTGRLDVFTRLICDGATTFDEVPIGYEGPLYAEVAPRSFPVLVRTGSRLNQMRLRRQSALLKDAELSDLHKQDAIISGTPTIREGLVLTVDLAGGDDGIVGFRAKRHSGVIDVDQVGAYDPRDFWEPLRREKSGQLVLDPHEFYILASKEKVAVPLKYAAEMVPIDPLVGEFRVHYAGFFDPGFGHSTSGGAGSRAVLEVRSHEVPFILEDGQTIGRLIYERLTEQPEAVYGSGIGSNYQAQGLKLSKHFRAYSDDA